MSALRLLAKEPSAPSNPHKAPAMSEPSEILNAVRDGGNWLPVATRTVEKIVAVYISSGEAFPEEIALMDLHYWIDKDSLKPFRYYAKRWKWKETVVRALFEKLGLLQKRWHRERGTQGGHSGDTRGTQESEKSEENKTTGTQGGHSGDTRGTQYRQTNTSEEIQPLPPVREAPTKAEVIAYGVSEIGCPEDVCRQFFNHYAPRGWLDAKNNPVLDWQLRLESWWIDEKKKLAQVTTHGSAQQGHTGQLKGRHTPTLDELADNDQRRERLAREVIEMVEHDRQKTLPPAGSSG